MDVTIGIDFGTATTKVVVNAEATRAYAVPFSSNNENTYLISSALSASHHTYSLFGDADGSKITGLKQSILDGNWDDDRIFPAVAFLGLIINYSRHGSSNIKLMSSLVSNYLACTHRNANRRLQQ